TPSSHGDDPHFVAAFKALVAAGADINAKDAAGDTPLLRFVHHLDESSDPNTPVATLLSCGANARATDKDGLTALHYVAQASHLEAVEALVRHAALLNATDKQGRTPLDVAQGDDVIKYLKQRGAKAGSGAKPAP